MRHTSDEGGAGVRSDGGGRRVARAPWLPKVRRRRLRSRGNDGPVSDGDADFPSAPRPSLAATPCGGWPQPAH